MTEDLSGRMEALSQIELFSLLKPDELEMAAGLFEEETFLKGKTVCKAGDDGDSFFVVFSGELEVWGGPDEGQLLARLGPGSPVGEMSLLMGDKRSATLAASQRTVLLVMDKDNFNRLLLKNTKILEYFSKIICQRLVATSSGESVASSTMVLSVNSDPGLKGTSLVSSSLAKLLKQFTGDDVVLVKIQVREGKATAKTPPLLLEAVEMAEDRLRGQLTKGEAGITELTLHIRGEVDLSSYGERLANLVLKLRDHFAYIVFDLVSDLPALRDSVGEFTDVLVKIVNFPTDPDESAPDAPFTTYEVVNLYNENSRPLPISSCEPFVLRNDASLMNGALLATPVPHGAVPLHRLARKVLGQTVGIALGGGAAFGLSHLGVLQVLERNQIPIDLVAGCSMGSMIGIAYAAGFSLSDMIEKAHEMGKRSKMILGIDFSLSAPGVLAGNRLRDLYTPLLGSKQRFEDLVKPCRTVATDIESGERVDIGKGSLEDAYRASIAVPVVISPIKIDGRVLVDGGVSDPVPAEVVRNMGADICIAVNVVPPLKKGVEMALSRYVRKISKFNPLSYLGPGRDFPNLFDITMNSLQTLQHELGNFKAISADVRVNPDLAEFTWIEYYRSKEIIDKGIEATERMLPMIKKKVGMDD
jgi:NTE family protein